jgi:putative salt-induced outer membrane protein YdiY
MERLFQVHTFVGYILLSSKKMKISFRYAFAKSTVGAITFAMLMFVSTPDVSAAEGQQSGWRSGVSRWNGTSYDIAESPSDDSIPAPRISEPPYIVPTEPGGPITNPYFQPEPVIPEPRVPTPPVPAARVWEDSVPTPRIPTPRKDNSAVSLNAAAQPYGESVSDLDISITDPSIQSSPPDIAAIAPGSESETLATSTPPSEVSEPKQSAAQTGPTPSAYVEQPPLEQEVLRWYQYPQRWMKGWNSHAEFGLDGSDGNANTLAIQTGLEIKRKTELHTFAIDIDYRQASAGNATTENNGRLNTDYDRMIADSKWSAFSKFGLEWDRFKAFDLRLNLNGGLGYHWIRDDDASLVTRFGAGASREIGSPDDAWIPEAVFGIDSERQLNSRNKLKGKLDYFPAWDNFGDFRLVADAAWEILLDDSDNLSLKLAVTDRYDSTPQGAKPNDVYYSLLLLYKF